MQTKLRNWMPIALCCVPAVVAVGVGVSLALGDATFGTALGGPLGVGLVALGMLACPVSMGLMSWRRRRSKSPTRPGSTPSWALASCCLPGDQVPANRLAALRAQREALERELAEIEAH